MNMSDKTEPEKPKPRLDPRLFLPVEGNLEEQVEMQVSFLTDGIVECMVRATELFEPPVAPEPDNYWKKPSAAPPPPTRRSQELRDAAHLSNATARLIGAYAKLRGEFHFTYSRNENVPPAAGGERPPILRDGTGRPVHPRPRRKPEPEPEAECKT